MPPLVNHRSRNVRVDQVRVVENALAETYLTATMAASSGTLTVKDIAGFAVGKFVWINPFGPNSEIVAVHAATAPTGSTITLAANTAFTHVTGEEVLYVEFNQLEISHSATAGGVKAVLLAATGLIAREHTYVYLETAQTSGYYFARFKNSVSAAFGSYSDALPYGGWESNTAGYMIDMALRELSITFSDKVTIQDCLHWINKGMREIKSKLRQWPEHAVSNYVAGQTTQGINTVAMPTNIYDTETNRSIRAVRVGDDKELHYLEPSSFDAQMAGVKVATVRTQAVANDTSLLIANSYDFADSGTVHVYIAGVQYSIDYTGVTRSATAGVLTGIPASGAGSITVTIPVSTNVWQDQVVGQPQWYTVRNGALEFWPLPSSSYDNQNVYLDYDTEVTVVDSESDVIDYQRFDMLQSYLEWRMWCKAENDGKLDRNSGYYGEYKEYLNDAIRTMPSRQTTTAPNVNRMTRRGWAGRRADPKMLSIDEQ
ncbi:MAG TPA: hypothetical protein VFY78_09875 [Gammaproteobacteria bacterium]|nr:hypothetical protein [Gammaproteobacteria bacterium]